MNGNYSNRRPRGYDNNNGEEDIYDDPDMPPRGRASPAALWEVANGAADAAMGAEALAAFVEASVRQFDPDW